MSATLSITFNNMSKTSFARSIYGNDEAWVDTNVQLPSDTLHSEGSEVFSIDNSGTFGYGKAYAWCCWRDTQGGGRFGVKICDSAQVLKMGWAPTWQVMSDHAAIDADPDWQNAGDDPASPYVWNQTVGYRIIGRPEADGNTLFIVVTIQDLKVI